MENVINILFKALIIYYVGINIVLLVTMYLDKHKAIKDQRRIPEATLFIMALLGGSVGGFLGMKLFHHKSRKIYFYIIYLIALVLHIAFLYLICTKFIFK